MYRRHELPPARARAARRRRRGDRDRARAALIANAVVTPRPYKDGDTRQSYPGRSDRRRGPDGGLLLLRCDVDHPSAHRVRGTPLSSRLKISRPRAPTNHVPRHAI